MSENIKDERIQLRVSKEEKHKLKVLASINDMNIRGDADIRVKTGNLMG